MAVGQKGPTKTYWWKYEEKKWTRVNNIYQAVKIISYLIVHDDQYYLKQFKTVELC